MKSYICNKGTLLCVRTYACYMLLSTVNLLSFVMSRGPSPVLEHRIVNVFCTIMHYWFATWQAFYTMLKYFTKNTVTFMCIVILFVVLLKMKNQRDFMNNEMIGVYKLILQHTSASVNLPHFSTHNQHLNLSTQSHLQNLFKMMKYVVSKWIQKLFFFSNQITKFVIHIKKIKIGFL